MSGSEDDIYHGPISKGIEGKTFDIRLCSVILQPMGL